VSETDTQELDRLRRENARLIGLLKAHGIAWQPEAPTAVSVADELSGHRPLSTQQKLALFQRLFRSRDDVYAMRWESTKSGRSGYAPACANEWQEGICEKPRVACRDCSHRQLLPLTDAAIYGHLAGEQLAARHISALRFM
jgi:hypothetical protein